MDIWSSLYASKKCHPVECGNLQNATVALDLVSMQPYLHAYLDSVRKSL